MNEDQNTDDFLCEHGYYHCATCEIKLLKKVIEELQITEQRYNFVNDKLKELTSGEKINVVMEGRVYVVKYRGIATEVYLPLKDVSSK